MCSSCPAGRAGGLPHLPAYRAQLCTATPLPPSWSGWHSWGQRVSKDERSQQIHGQADAADLLGLNTLDPHSSSQVTPAGKILILKKLRVWCCQPSRVISGISSAFSKNKVLKKRDHKTVKIVFLSFFFSLLVCILEMWFVILESKSWSNENK